MQDLMKGIDFELRKTSSLPTAYNLLPQAGTESRAPKDGILTFILLHSSLFLNRTSSQHLSCAINFLSNFWFKECPDLSITKCPITIGPRMAKSPMKSRILCLTNSFLYLRPSSFKTLNSSMTIALSSDPPFANQLFFSV